MKLKRLMLCLELAVTGALLPKADGKSKETEIRTPELKDNVLLKNLIEGPLTLTIYSSFKLVLLTF